MATELSKPRGAFPHLREHGGIVYVSGTSARQPDNSIAGAAADDLGTVSLDMSVQATAVLDNIESVLTIVGLNRSDILDATVFLVNMNDFGAYNAAWAAFFEGVPAPARTTIAVHQLPHPHLLIEIKATAAKRGED
ncbi:MAG: RidA family protein [Actinobacteria bacterium]|nr:RidA family protein [Actinomycetota bacterium]